MYHAERRHLPVQYVIRDFQKRRLLSETGFRSIRTFLLFVACGTVVTICSVELQFWASKSRSPHDGGSGTPSPTDTSTSDARDQLVLQELGLLAALINVLFKYVVDLVVRLYLASKNTV